MYVLKQPIVVLSGEAPRELIEPGYRSHLWFSGYPHSPARARPVLFISGSQKRLH